MASDNHDRSVTQAQNRRTAASPVCSPPDRSAIWQDLEMGVLEGQVAIVTGAGQGVGRGVALAVANEGAKVAVLGRTLSKCEAVAAEISERGGEAVAERCDVG